MRYFIFDTIMYNLYETLWKRQREREREREGGRGGFSSGEEKGLTTDYPALICVILLYQVAYFDYMVRQL